MHGATVTESPPVDARIADLAARQHGVVARRQLLRSGLSRAAVSGRVRRGHLHAKHRGVYAVGHPRLTREGVLMAAVLAAGPDTALGFHAAAQVHGLRPGGAGLVDVVVGPGGRRGRAGIRMHRTTRELEPVLVDGIPCTPVAWTLADLAAVLDRQSLERALDRSEELRVFDLAEVDRELAARGRAPGTGHLRDVLLDRLEHGADVVRSVLEREFRDLWRTGRDAPIVLNAQVAAGPERFEVDVSFPGTSLLVELDGDRWHRSMGARRRDAHRDAALAAAGHRVLRLTWEEVVLRPAVGLARVDAALEEAATPT